MDRLDAGAWLDASHAGARVPRLDEYLRWIKGKAKVFLDVKRADLSQLLALVHDVQMQDDCFFWFGDPDACLLYTSDAADERSSVDLGGRRIIKKKNKTRITSTPRNSIREIAQLQMTR